MLTEQEYQEAFGIINDHTGSIYFPLRLDHLWHMRGDGDATAIFSFLLNLLKLKNSNRNDRRLLMRYDLWFRCMAKRIRSTLSMGEVRVRTGLGNLQKKGLIEVSRRKGNAIWIRVNTQELPKIEKAYRKKRGTIVSTKVRNGEPSFLKETGNHRFSNTNKPTKKKLSRSPASERVNGRTPLFGKQPELTTEARQDRDCAQLLWDELTKARLRDARSKFPSWIAEFRKLRIAGETDPQEIRTTLEWYVRHLGGDMIPEAFCARTFREKFSRIKSAKKRAEKSTGENSSRPAEDDLVDGYVRGTRKFRVAKKGKKGVFTYVYVAPGEDGYEDWQQRGWVLEDQFGGVRP